MYMKKSLICFFLFLFSFPMFAQPFGNEWIKNNQKYFKIPIGRAGIYRIDYTSLIPAATDMKIDLSTVKPKKWQMFYKGKEIPIYVSGENDNIFNNYDFIEFYATLNDGDLDKELYADPDFIANDKVSMITDSSFYYLTYLPASSPQNGWHMQNYKNTAYSSYTPEPYFVYESLVNFLYEYNRGRKYPVGDSEAENPEYTRAEGYCSQLFGNGTQYSSFTASVETRFLNSSGPKPIYAFASVGASDNKNVAMDHRFLLGVSKDNFAFQNILDTSFDGFQIIRKSQDLDPALLGSNSTFFKFEGQFIPGVGYQAHGVNFVSVRYPRNFDLNNASAFRFELPGNNSPRHVEWNNYAATRSFPMMYDLSNGYRMRAEKFNGTFARSILPPSSKSNNEYYICDSSEIAFLQANDIVAAMSYEALPDRTIITYDPTAAINRNKLLLLTHPKFIGEGSTQYLNLRGSSTYASPCELVGIQQIYDHFSYGVPHPIAITHFLKYLRNSGDTSLKFLFLVGRGYQTNLIRPLNKLNQNIIPSIGVPASDNMFATALLDSNLVPLITIGRLTVDRESEFLSYVTKLMEYDATANEFWKKSILHLAGGDNGNQAAYIKNRLDNAGGIVSAPPFGGKVITYTKSSVGISEPFLKQKAIDNVNAGVQMITFLGHGSAAVTDIDIGDTMEYNNERKYPVFYFNGCSIGNPCLGPPDKNIKLSGENFMKARKKGAIAFIAQTGLSELGRVDEQIQNFYDLIFQVKYTGSYTVGEAVRDLLSVTGNYNSELNRIQSRILFLQGDPAIRWFQPLIPDYHISDKSLFLYPSNMTAVSDSFAIAIPIENRGRFQDDSISVKIERSYPNNFLVTEHLFRIKSVGYRDTVYLYIKSKDAAAAGINRFTVTVNYDSKIYEEITYNNTATFNPYIPGNGINLVYPKRFDIVSKLPNDTVELVAQALNLFEKNYQFVFEIDTSYLFNSPWKLRDSSASIVGQLKSWKVKLLGLKDSTVYYWRAKINTGTIQGGFWSERSFIHILDHAPGWSQSDFPQFYPSSTLKDIELNKTSKQFEFSKTAEKVYVITWLDKQANFGIKKGGYGALSLNPGAQSNIVAILFHGNSLEQFKLPGIFNPNRYYGFDYYENSLKAYNFNLNLANQYQFINWVDSIPEGTYVAMCNVGGIPPSFITPQVIAAFYKLGAQMPEHIKTDLTSYAMIGKKGEAPGWAVEDTGHYYDGAAGKIEIEKELIGKKGSGSLKTELIGPTTEWGTLYLHTKPLETDSGDQFYVNVHGVTNGGKDSIIFNEVNTDAFDLSGIDARRFPNIYLEGQFQDLLNYTPPQIRHWRVTNAKVPEGSLNPNMSTLIWRDTLLQGEDFKFDIAFQNISELSFQKDLKYQVLIYNVDTKDTVLNNIFFRTDSLLPDASFMISSLKNTRQMRGRYAYAVKVNFDNNNRSAQPEMSLINNSALRYFYVIEDKINPLLDVTFDGRHIGNGEIVSGSPVISISSKDENKLNWQTDTNGIRIWLKRPNNVNFEVVDFDSSGVKFYPATSAYNLARAEYNPKNLPDGIYTLKVQSNDANGTDAGVTEYLINFTVINQASATNFYPYPNPFTTSMRFVFTLTGNEVPDYINVRIMTIQGKVVKELNKEDLGDIHIGNNITDVVWDGTDEFGDRLSNGVYLYVVTIRSNGQEVTQIESDNVSNDLNADKGNNNLFKHSTGKIVLLR